MDQIHSIKVKIYEKLQKKKIVNYSIMKVVICLKLYKILAVDKNSRQWLMCNGNANSPKGELSCSLVFEPYLRKPYEKSMADSSRSHIYVKMTYLFLSSDADFS